MGNTASGNNNQKSKKYAIDYETINIQFQQTLNTNADNKNQKTYFIMNYDYKNTYNHRVLKLSVKIMDNNVMVYINDKLIYVSKITYNTMNNAQMIDYYLKYVQISQDFNFLSIPEFNTVNVYNLKYDIEHPKYVGTIGVTFELDSNSNNLKTTIDKCVVEPLKCTLYSNMYTMICFDTKIKCMIVTFDFVNNKIYTNVEISNMKKNTINFSLNGKFIMWNDDSRQEIKIYDTVNGSINTTNSLSLWSKMISPECISNDGLIMLCKKNDTNIENTEKQFVNICTGTIYQITLHYPCECRNQKLKYYLVDDEQINIDVNSRTMGNEKKLYILIGWDQQGKKYYYWLIQFTTEKIKISDSWTMNYNECHKIDYVHHNGSTFMYKIANMMIIYELNKIIPIKYVDMYSNDAFKLLKKLYEKKHIDGKYFNSLEIVAADDSSKTYTMQNFTKFILSMHTDYNETNVFQLRVTSNINIYGTIKSFDIFQNLLLRHDGSEIIENIVLIPEIDGRHNMMLDLITHIYEYVRVFVLKELNVKKNEKTEFDTTVSLYIGYTMMSFVLKYYLVLSKIQKHDTIKFDIIHTFNQNFPLFEKFINKSIGIMMDNSEKN